MPNTLRFGLSAIALASALAGCATPQAGAGSAASAAEQMGFGTRAAIALNNGQYEAAVGFAEQAVEKTPNEASFRSLLGDAYFGMGRFASAEAAYKDSLTLQSSQPKAVLKLALVQIALGKSGEALGLLQAADGLLPASDYGLAVALAGDPQRAIAALEPAARERGAEARVRQNLALAHALAGDWSTARLIAGQDLSPDLVDARIQQWMALAKPARASDQIAALTGVTPAASDPGQPVRLALHDNGTRVAEVQPQPAQPAPAPAMIAAAPLAMSAPSLPEPVAPIFAEAAPVEPAPAILSEPVSVAEIAPIDVPTPAEPAPVAAKPVVRAAAFVPAKKPVRAAAVRSDGRSSAVVQLGAYGSRQRVSAAWDALTKRYPALRGYTPLTARFESAGGTVYRLSIKGFDSQREAIGRCRLLQSRGGSCFVRTAAGDAPVQFASR